jgi:hypothetical protein
MINKFTRPESPVAGLDERARKLRDTQSRGLSLGVSHEGRPGAGAAPPSVDMAGIRVPGKPPHAQPTDAPCPDCNVQMDELDSADDGTQRFQCPGCGGVFRLVPTDDGSDDDDDSDGDDSSDFGNDQLADAGVPDHPNLHNRRAAMLDDVPMDQPASEELDESGGDADAPDEAEMAALADQFPMIECHHCKGVWQLREMAMPQRCPNLECQAVLSTRNVRLSDSARDLLDKATKRRGRDRFSEV